MPDGVLDPSYLGNLSEMQCVDGRAGVKFVKLGGADKSGNP